MGTGISEASKRVPIFSFATQGKFLFSTEELIQAREAQILREKERKRERESFI